MFTGIIREIGHVRSVREAGDRRIEIRCARPAEEIEIGASIACSGVCLTVVETGRDDGRSWFAVEVSAETCARTTLGGWQPGSRVNLEPALRVGDELGGHIVSGHVDGLAGVVDVRPEGGSHRLDIRAPAGLGRYLAEKGSVALDGISLTVNAVEDREDGTVFGVNIIPHTWSVTTLAEAGPGTTLNLEVDLMARYVARLAEAG
jgi:riboflavin synthase